MAFAFGTALISTILPPMVDKAMDINKDKGKAIVRSMADKAMDNIERDISRLQTTLYTIEGIVQVAEEKQIDDDFIRNWLRDLVDIAYEARDVLDDFITFSSCIITAGEASNPVNTISSLTLSYVGGSSSDTSNIPLTVLNRLKKDIRSVSERFDEKIKEGERFATLIPVVEKDIRSVRERFDEMTKKGETFTKLKSVVESVRVDLRQEVGPFLNKQGDGLFLEREDVKERIMEKLLNPSDDNRVHVVAIWGMGGIGKTTLAQSIYNDARVKEDEYPTENRRWLCVGKNKFSAEKVIKAIVNDSSNNDDIDSLQTKLMRKYSGNKFLIVLDDVWGVDGSEWDLLFNPLTNVGKGGLIIITTGIIEVRAATNTQTTYYLMPLSEEDSWSIFESYAYVNGKADSTSELKPIGEEIVKKLNGHPLALKVVGRSLLNKDYSTWTKFLESKLTKDDEVMSALRWSYNHLPRHLKMCFTYCALFPKDHVFDKKVLVQMWMAHDLIQKEEQERPEDVGAQYFEQLVNASLLECIDGKHVMHDLIHDLALLVSNGEFASANSSLTNDQMKKIRHMTITPGDYSEIPRLCKIEKLLTLYTICSDGEDFDGFDDYALYDVFNQLKSIRVLVLSSKCLYEIPDCTSKLKDLRYLDVSKTRVKSLPDSLCHLYNLQMLAAPLDAELPRDIVNISRLRYVRANLSTCKGVGKLTSLQQLSSIHVCVGDNISELGVLRQLRGKLRIKGLENVEKFEEDVGALMEKQTLMDELELEFNQDSAKSTISAQVLDALGCPRYLTYLGISGYNGLKPPSWMVDGKQKFDKLQTLYLRECPMLESLPPLGEFDKLQTLELSDCPKLESLPPLGELTSLKRLSLWKVGVKKLGDEFYGKFTDGKVFFPSLESLRFSYMEEWEKWDDIIIKNSSVSFFPSLTTLKIERCAKLVLVLPVVKNRTLKRKQEDKQPIRNAANFMTSLSRLEIISYCDGLKRLQLDALVSLKELNINCWGLETIDFERLPSLKSLDVSYCRNLISIRCPVGIKSLHLYECESLRSLSIDIRGLDSLEYFRIIDCPVLELTFEEGSSSSSSGNSVAIQLNICTKNKQIFTKLFQHKFVSLKSLKIDSVTKFENFSETEENNFCNLRSLKSLCISQCEDLKSLPANFYKLSSLNSLRIDNCPKLQSLSSDFYKLSCLNRLEIISCSQLQSLPPDFHKILSLNSMKIVDCPQLQSLPSLGLPIYMKSLELLNCPLLYERCKDESSFDWHKIKHIHNLAIFGDDKVHRYGGHW